MELWIRSQDKRKLLKVNDDLYIANGFNDTDDTFIGIKNVGHIGRYVEEKRALEVLDEIQENIVRQGQVIILTDERGIPNGSKFFSYVYEMPEE